MTMKKSTRMLTQGGIIAALYVVLTLVSALVGLSSGAIQLRLGEALTILPMFTPAAIPGLFVGCVLANLITGCLPWDIVFGSLATLLGALGTRYLSPNRWIAPVWPILANALIVPVVLQKVYGVTETYWYLLITVGIGEILSCGVLGILLYAAVRRTGIFPAADGVLRRSDDAFRK